MLLGHAPPVHAGTAVNDWLPPTSIVLDEGLMLTDVSVMGAALTVMPVELLTVVPL
jgi:hypothetical protein